MANYKKRGRQSLEQKGYVFDKQEDKTSAVSGEHTYWKDRARRSLEKKGYTFNDNEGNGSAISAPTPVSDKKSTALNDIRFNKSDTSSFNAIPQHQKQKEVKNTTSEGSNVKEQLADMNKNGNIDLLNRPVISTKKLEQAGWGKQGDGTATVYSSSYSNEDGTKTVLVTPILQNGRVLTPDELERAANDILNSGVDNNKILMGTFTGKNSIAEAGAYGQKVHELHEVYYSGKNKGTAAAKLPEIGSNSFENIPTYKEQKKAYKDNTAAEFKGKYGVDMSEFKQSDYYKWATEHGFVFMHDDQAGLSESPRMGTKHSEEDIAEEKRLRYLLQYNNRREELEQDKNGAVKAAASGARNSIAFNTFKRLENWADKNDSMKQHGKYVNALSEEYKANLADIDTQYEQNHPTAKAVGEGAADLAKLTALQGVIGKAVDGIGWLASKPQWVIRAVKDGLAFGIKNGLDSAGRGDDAKTVARNTGIGTVGGAAGGTAAHFTGVALENVLFRYGLQNKVIPEIIRNGAAAANFSLADTASTYFLHPENERPSAQEIAKNAGVAFAFASITTAVHTSEIKSNSKQTLDNLDKSMTASYEEMLRAAVEKDGVNTKKFAQNVIDYTEAMERYLDGKGVEILDDNAASSTVGEYLVEQGKVEPKTNETVLEKARFVGEDSRVRSIKSDLQEIRSRAQEYLTKADAIIVDSKVTDTPLEIEGAITEPIRTQKITTPKAEPVQTVSREISPRAQEITTELSAEYNIGLVGAGNKIDEAYKALHDNPTDERNAITAWEISSEVGRSIAQGSKADNVEETGNNIAARIFEKLFEDISIGDNADTDSASETADNETAAVQTSGNSGFIDEREYDKVGKRNINAFQYDNPEVKPFYKAAANELLSDISSTVKGQKVYISSSNMANGTPDRVTGQRRLTSESIAKIKDVTGASYDQIKDALTRLINDNGQENIALAKRIELVIDDMLTDGYTDFNGNKIPPNEEYIAVKNRLNTQGAESSQNTQTAEAQPEMADYRAKAVTENITKGMSAKTGAPSRADNIQSVNSRIQSDSNALFDRDFVRAYTKDFLIGMAQRNNEAFKALKQMDGYVGEELIKEVIHGNAAPEYKNNNYFRGTVEELKKVLADAAEKNVIMRNRTYGESEQLNQQFGAIRNGDFSVVDMNEYGFAEVPDGQKTPGLIQDEYSEYLMIDEKIALDGIGTAIGVPIKIVESINSGRVDGCYLNGAIYIAQSAKNKPMIVFSHEVTHSIEGTSSYKYYKGAVLDILARRTGKYITELVNEKIADYGKGNVKLTADAAERELVAEYTKNILSTPEEAMEFVKKLEEAETNGAIPQDSKQSIVRSIIDAIKSILAKIKGAFIKTPQAVKDLQTTKELFENMLKEAANETNVQTDDKTQFLQAGKNAKTANHNMLAKAEEMENTGASNEEIRQATTWGRGIDSEWRFEIDDSDSKYIGGDKTGSHKLSEIFKHDELYKSYPELRDMEVFVTDNTDKKGTYSPELDKILLNENLSDTEKRKTLLHEVQHAIQVREGFAVGADSNSENYRNTAGEIEARDVSARADMTAEERQENFPESMKPRDDVVFADRGVMADESKRIKITRDMTDSERYNILKDIEMDVVKYNPEKMKQVEGLNENELNTQFKRAAKPLLNKIADEFNVFKSYSIEDIELEANYSHGSFNESANKQHKNYQDFGKLLTVFDDVIKNAVGIEVHDDIYKGTQKENTHLLNTYVLISAFQDGEDTIPVKLVVKELDNDPNKIHLTVSANKIKAEISAQVSSKNARLPYAPSASTISLSEMFKKINPKDAYLLKYVPEQFLTDEQKEAVSEENVKDKQRIQPLTKDFKNWFGDWQNNPENASKVVNEDGTPKIMYHGTLANGLHEFKKEFIGSRYSYDDTGFFFISRKTIADDYATSEFDSNKRGEVISAYLDVKNPFVFDSQYARKNGYGNIFKNNDVIDIWDTYQSAILDEIENGQYDGIIIDDGTDQMAVVFEPTQIKSATDNIGTFDPNNEDIRFSLADKVEEYGEIPKGEKPARDVDVPKKISDKQYVSRFARTAMEAGVTPDEAVSEFEKEILDGTMTHEAISDKNAMESAESLIKSKGFKAVLDAWDVLIDRGKALSKQDIALGQQLYNQCINNKDVTNAMKIAADLSAEATRSGQSLQAVRMLKKLSPDGKLYYLERSVNDINREFKNKLGDSYKDVRLNEDLMKEFLEADTDETRNEVYDKICQDIADQIPSTIKDKWNAWRYLSMLGNPKTHIRNIVGNAVFYPAVRIKSYINAGLEKTFVKKENRTSSFAKNKESKAYAAKDFELVKKELQGVNAKYAVTDDIESKRRIFKVGALEFLRKKNGDFLEAEDLWFLKAHYEDAFARVMTARGITAEQLDDGTKESNDLLNKVREIAMREAQEATYRDANSVANALNKMQRGAEKSKNRAVRAVGVGIEAVMPFKKTPLNIAKRGIEYSPIGLLNGVWNAATGVKKGKITASEAINKISKGFVGTGLMMIGYLLANMGLLTGEGDENKKKADFDGLVGKLNYALNIAGKSYTIDWMAPISMPLFIGVELQKATKEKEWTFAKVVDAMSTISEPLLELSCLSSLQGLIQSVQYSENNTAFSIITELATSYLTQGLPTFGGQLARTIDGKKRNAYYRDKDNQMPIFIQQFIGQVAAKVPGASKMLEPKIDKWGREEDYGELAERMIENSISPGYYSEERYTKVDKELERLNKSVGGNDMFPIGVQKSVTIDGVTYNLNVHQYTQFARLRGQKSFELVEDLMNDNIRRKKKGAKVATTVFYDSLDDEEKVKQIKKCYDDALDYAKEEISLMLTKKENK